MSVETIKVDITVTDEFRDAWNKALLSVKAIVDTHRQSCKEPNTLGKLQDQIDQLTLVKPIDTTNKFGVSVRAGAAHDGRDILVMMMPSGGMTRDDALLLAAYLVSLADPGGEQFPCVLEAVQNV